MTLKTVAVFQKPDTLKRVLLLAAGVVLLAAGGMAVAARRAEAAACAAPSGDFGTSTSTVKVDNAATYRIWSRMLTSDTTNNSYLLEVDGNSCFTVGDTGLTPGTWTWVDYQNGNTGDKIFMNLTAGNHSIKMIGREGGVKLDRVLFVSDTDCTPTGNGSNCTVAGDTTPPAVDLTAPQAGASVEGTVNITATASDNVGVTKVEFYLNGTLAATDLNAPYSYSWNTAGTANGPVSIMAKSYDAAGNTSSDTRQATVANGDKQAPSTPGGVSAQANAYNKVTVTWNASTDNVGVTGYRVSRNGVTLGDVTGGRQYVDNTVLPSTTYNYQVVAFDAARNVSGLSTVATVTTPAAPAADTQAPSVPGGLRATAAGKNQINLSWTASSDNVGVAAYDVYRSTGSITAGKVATVTTTSFGDTGLKANTKYTYYVIARDKAGNASAKSSTATAKTEAEAKVGHGKLKGHVSFSKKRWWNRPLVIVHANGHRQIHSVKANGDYTISGLPAGTYRVTYVAFGARSQTVNVKIEANKVKTQNITLRSR